MSILILIAAATLGAVAGAHLAGRLANLRSGKTTAVLCVLALLATLGTKSSETLIEGGMDFTAVDVIEAASYFTAALAMMMGWRLARPPAWRWLFATLVPVAMYEPLRIGWRLLAVLLR